MRLVARASLPVLAILVPIVTVGAILIAAGNISIPVAVLAGFIKPG